MSSGKRERRHGAGRESGRLLHLVRLRHARRVRLDPAGDLLGVAAAVAGHERHDCSPVADEDE